MARSVDGSPATAGIADSELRRDVSVWGSYMWGYADVGADIYTALGIVALAALGLTPVAFLFAGTVYALVGLCYAELASAYPVAGGGQFFTLRGLGDVWGFLAGAALLLDYVIDISLFTVIAFGYLNFFLPYLTFGHSFQDFAIDIGPLHLLWLWLLETIAGIALLIWLNSIGIRISSLVNEVLGVVTIVAQSVIVITGFVFVWRPDLFVHQLVFNRPSLGQFAFGTSLAIISFVGLESISQVAQETRRPATIIPRTSIGLILSVLLFAIAFSVLATGMIDPSSFKGHEGDPVSLLAAHIPLIGAIAAPLTALVGGIVVYISANSGVVSVSRLTYSMSQFQLLPAWFKKVHPRYRTPARTIVVFSVAAIIITLFAFVAPGKPGSNAAIDVLADLYAFGATFGYLLVFVSLIVLRFRDPYTPRPYRMPINLRIRARGQQVWFPVLGVAGFVGVLFFLVMVIATHAYARVAGPVWILLAFLLYILYRRRRNLPGLQTLPRDWESVTKQVLTSAEEWQSLEEYEAALTEHERDQVAGS
jgi:basic amino acid/polyamine antiporter, APA family